MARKIASSKTITKPLKRFGKTMRYILLDENFPKLIARTSQLVLLIKSPETGMLPIKDAVEDLVSAPLSAWRQYEQQKLLDNIQQIRKKIKLLEKRVDHNRFESPEFYQIAKKLFRELQAEYANGKIEALRGSFVSTLLKENIDEYKNRSFIDVVLQLQPLELSIFKIILETKDKYNRFKYEDLKKSIKKAEIPEDDSSRAVNTLQTLGLIYRTQHSAIGGDIEYRGVTPFGLEFARFINPQK